MTAPRTKTQRRRGRGEQLMVPEAEFTSYYGRPVVKASPWTRDIPAYFFLGGLAAGSSLLAAGGDVTRQPTLRRRGRLTALGAISAGTVALVHDLGRPARFHHMLRVAKPTSPMSVGTWLLSAYAPLAGLAAATEVAHRLPRVGRWSGLGAAAVAPAIASYTAVLVTDTATPTWHALKDHLPAVFTASAASAAGGAALLVASLEETAVARQLGVLGAVTELAVLARAEQSMGMLAEPLHEGTAGAYSRAAKGLTAGGAALAAVGRRSRWLSAAAGAALLAGSWCSRFAVFHAGQQSAEDPRYTVVPQRERIS